MNQIINLQSNFLAQKQHKTYEHQLKNLIKLVLVSSILYLVLSSFSLITILVSITLLAAIFKLCSLKFNKLRKEGFTSYLSQDLKKLLFQKSIFDIFSDSIYFDTLTPILAAFLKPFFTKPSPQKLYQQFQQLPQDAKSFISRKGVLSLASQNVQRLMIGAEKSQKLLQNYGKTNWQWYNSKKYELHHQKPHEQTIQKYFIQTIDQKVNWKTFSILLCIVGLTLKSIGSKKLKQILVRNGSISGFILILVFACVKLNKMKDKKNNQVIAKKQLKD